MLHVITLRMKHWTWIVDGNNNSKMVVMFLKQINFHLSSFVVDDLELE